MAAIKEEIICKESVNTNDLINKYEFAKIVLNSNKNITIAVYFKENNSWKRYFVGLHKVMPSDCGDF